MSISKDELLNYLEEYSVMLELNGENSFKIRAYRNAIELIEKLEGNISDWIESGKLFKLKGIGSSLSEKIKSFYEEKNLEFYYDLKEVSRLWKELDILDMEDLVKACNENKLLSLKGFGEKTQMKILKNINIFKRYEKEFYYLEAYDEAYKIIHYLKTNKIFSKVELAGSLRRVKELVKDIDILVSTTDISDAVNFITSYPEINDVLAKGETKVSFRLNKGITVDIRLVSEKEFPYALLHFTGSKEHNTAMRHRSKKLGFKMNEYGLFKNEDELIKCQNETEIFNKLGLQFITPEIRENNGEIEASEKNEIPELITVNDIKGMIHFHTNYSDGKNTLQDYVDWAKLNGISYLFVADHSQSAFYANGMKPRQLAKQWLEIDKLNKENPEVKIFKGIESDILPHGELDYPEKILKEFDFIIGSIHSNFNLPEEQQTNRIVEAVKNPYLTILGHLSGRLLKQREAYKIDMEKILTTLKNENKIVEFNSSYQRLDIDWRYLKRCKNDNILVSISSDAHNIDTLNNYKAGVQFCRKGWLTKTDVINAFTLEKISNYLNSSQKK
jgi:DNA polymerase (family X)